MVSDGERALEERAFVGDHELMRQVLRYLERVAATSSTLLITGETGTGKELAARYLHERSTRSQQAFVAVNCAAVPDSLFESELFGFERGAFTGARESMAGKWKSADGGTLFLDEIADMSATAQAKILRVMENQEVWSLGATRGRRVDVRIVAATNGAIEDLVARGRFRADLYYRLNVARLRLPPLRERRSDIPLLIRHYVRRMNAKFQRQVAGFSPDVMLELGHRDWPGNIRELKNLVEAAFIELPENTPPLSELPAPLGQCLLSARALPIEEKQALIDALNEAHWNVSKAAARLQMSRMTVYRKLAKYKIDPSSKRCDTVRQS